MASVLDLVKHYQQSIESHAQDEQKVLKAIDKLFHLDVKVQHLQDTGVGRTVNALRKEPGNVGKAARALVYKWKTMVAAEESDQEGDHETTTNGNGKDSDSNVDQTRHRRDSNEKSNSSSRSYHKEVREDYNKVKRKYQSSEEEEEPEVKKSKHSNYIDEDSKRRYIKSEPSDSDSQDSNTESDDSESDRSESSEEDKRVYNHKKIKTELTDDHKPSKHNSSNNINYKKEFSNSSKKSSHSSNEKHSKHHSSESRHPSEKSSPKDKSHISKDKSIKETERKHKEHKSSDKDKRSKEESRSSSKHSSNQHRASSQQTDSSSSDKQKSSEKHVSKSEKHSSSQKPEKHKHKSSSEKDTPNDKHKSKDSSSSSKVKSSSSREKSKEKSSSSKEKSSSSSSHKSDKKSSSVNDCISKSDSKAKSNKISSDRNSEKKSSQKSSSSSSHKSSSNSSKSSKSKDDIPKKKAPVNNEDSDDGIDCESGASFAEALGMITPAKSKKKSTPIKNAHSPNNSSSVDLSPATLLAPSAKLAPLPALEISALPEISPNYKPRPPPKFLPHFSDEDAMSAVISSKNQRTKVYSGNKIIGKIPSLYELCVNVLQEHIDALEYTGGVPYEILKPVVDKATPQQLFMLEHYNPYLMEDTEHLWQKFCEKHFRNKKRQEMETHREMFMRCQEEQEIKLRSLTENIKLTQEAKKAPIKQTKMAYVDTIVKPPRNVARKQALHGTAHAATASPAARVAALSTAANVLKPGSIRPPPAASVSSSSFNKPKKAPLMQKALQFMRGRKR